MIYNGWIKLHRKYLNNPIFKKPKLSHYFIYCLLKANHAPESILWNKQEIVIDRGEFITGRNTASKETGLTSREIRTSLDWLVSLRIVEISTSKTTSKFTVVKIINYSTYQDFLSDYDQQNDHEATSKRPASDQQSATNKNVNNNKKEKKKDICVKASRERPIYTPDFESFWKKYPYPRRTGKEESFKSFTACLDAGYALDEILGGLNSYQKEWQILIDKCESRSIPMPTTWLNQHRFLDREPSEKSSKEIYLENRRKLEEMKKHEESKRQA